MGQTTKIDWCDATWNPVTGCLHGCEYCYARRIVKRFNPYEFAEVDGIHAMHQPYRDTWLDENGESRKGRIEPYPFGFDPTLHRYKLDDPQKWKKPRTVFVCSMADLFGDWVPDEWIKDVFEACAKAPQHRYLFLTKNPKRYVTLYMEDILPVGAGYWYGTTVTEPEQPFFGGRTPDDNPHTFVSIEPILKPFGEIKAFPEWVIIGAETGNRKGRIAPKKAWIDEIAQQAQERRVPVFMKESLRGLMGEDFRQEFPWGRDAGDQLYVNDNRIVYPEYLPKYEMTPIHLSVSNELIPCDGDIGEELSDDDYNHMIANRRRKTEA